MVNNLKYLYFKIMVIFGIIVVIIIILKKSASSQCGEVDTIFIIIIYFIITDYIL